MQEILYRGKRVDTGEWVEGYYLKTNEHISNRELHIIIFATYSPLTSYCMYFNYEVIPETVGRLVNDPCYTDFTEQRYFQGDIIELRHQHDVDVAIDYGVVVDEHCFTVNGLGRNFPQDTLKAKVVGNIWDNPELINERYIRQYKERFCLNE